MATAGGFSLSVAQSKEPAFENRNYPETTCYLMSCVGNCSFRLMWQNFYHRCQILKGISYNNPPLGGSTHDCREKSWALGGLGDEGHFHWREYREQIPRDAFRAGTDARGRDLYIGCAIAKMENISYGFYPGSIIADQRSIEIIVDHEVQSRQEAVWILCTKAPDKLHWSKKTTWTFNDAFTSSTSTIKGGLQIDNIKTYPIYIGRYQSGYGFEIGKIVTCEGDNERPFYYVATSGRESKSDQFEALIFHRS